MRDNGSAAARHSQASTSSPTGHWPCTSPVDHIWVEGLDFETFLIRGSDDVTFKNNDIGPGKSNHYDEKLWVSVGHDGSNYVNNYTTNLVLDGNVIHGFTRETNAPRTSCHVECLHRRRPRTSSFRNNQFLDCDIFGIILADDGVLLPQRAPQNRDRGQRHPLLQDHDRLRARPPRLAKPAAVIDESAATTSAGHRHHRPRRLNSTARLRDLRTNIRLASPPAWQAATC